MTTTTETRPQAPNPYGTAANPELQRHHWQHLAGMVYSLRPEWAVSEIIEHLWWARDRRTFPELAQLGVAVALDPRCDSSVYIRIAAVEGKVTL
jgi:hypothetical protein